MYIYNISYNEKYNLLEIERKFCSEEKGLYLFIFRNI